MQRAPALAYAGETQRRKVSSAIGMVFVQDSGDAARTQWRSVVDQPRGKFPKLGMLVDGANNNKAPRARHTVGRNVCNALTN